MDRLDRAKLKAARKKLRLTQEALAELTGITERTIRYIENENTTPRSGTLHVICLRLNLTMDSVFIRQNGDESDA